MKRSLFFRIAAGVVALGAFGFLFFRSLEDTRTSPYMIEPQHLGTWSLALETPVSPNDPLLVLRPSPELANGVFKQIFARAMESLNTPTVPSMPVVLRHEFDRVVGDQLTRDALIAAARAAGLEASAPVPRCLVHRRISEPGGVRQVFLVYFDAPALAAFRREIGLEPGVLSPVLFVAGAGPDFNSWLPQRVDPGTDCLAPIEISDR